MNTASRMADCFGLTPNSPSHSGEATPRPEPGLPRGGTRRSNHGAWPVLRLLGFCILIATISPRANQIAPTENPLPALTNVAEIRALSGEEATSTNSLPILTRASDVQALSEDQAKLGYPVRLRAVMTYRDPIWNMMFVQDESGGIYVHVTDVTVPVSPGQLVELEGHSSPGEFAPVVELKRVKALEDKAWPVPRPATLDELMTGRLDSQWVELIGIPHVLTNEGGHLVLTLAVGKNRFNAILPGYEERSWPAHLVDAQIRLRGACGTIFNKNRQWTGLQLYVPSMEQIEVLVPAPADPFNLPVRPIRSLFRFDPQVESGHRVRVQGIVTYQRLGQSLFIRDDTDSLYVTTSQSTALQLGDRVEVVGFPVIHNNVPELEDCLVRRVGSGAPPEPVALTPEQARSGDHDAELVSLEGRLVDRTFRYGDTLLVMQSASSIFEVQMEPAKGARQLAELPLGSRLRLTGICSVYADRDGVPKSFRIFLRSADDVVVLARPSWWTAERTMATLGGMGLIVLASVLWGVTLRRRVQTQTALIRDRLERETRLEERYRELVENASDMVYAHDLEGNYISVNKAGERILGYSQPEFSLMNGFQILDPECREFSREMLRRKLARGGQTTYELTYVAKDGHRVTMEVNTRLIEQDGKIIGVHGIARDLTERRRAEQSLRETEHLYRRAIAAADAIPYRRDYTTETFAFMGEGILQMTGYAIPEMTPQVWDSLVRDVEMRGEMTGLAPEEALEQARAGHFRNWRSDCRIQTRSGEFCWIADSSIEIPGEDGKPVGSIGILQDITERKQAELEIERLANFPRFNPNPVLEFAADGSLAYFNAATESLAKSLGGAHPSAILPSETENLVKTCLATGQKDVRLETRIQDRTIAWAFFPMQQSRVVHCYASDLTERLNLEAQLRQAQKMDAVGQLAAGVAHDFNNLLTVMQGNAELLQMDGELAATHVESARQISHAAMRAASLTKQLLMFSRKQVMQARVLELNELIANLMKMLRRLIGEHIDLVCEFSSSLPDIYADPSMIEQTIVNLAVNARDAMPEGGWLTLKTATVEINSDTAHKPPDARAGQFVCLSVMDTGCGMDAPTLQRIFEPFFTTKEIGKGTGLGLATVYGIVQQHKGWIDASSQPGQGSAFQIYFPAQDRKAVPVEEHAPSPVRGGTETILVVEDEPALCDMVQSILRHQGYRVFTASSGMEALGVWAEHKTEIDLLFTDLVMPHGVSGRALAEQTRGEKPQLKVLLTSGYSPDLFGQLNVWQDGVNFLPKPYRPQTLANVVRRCLDGEQLDRLGLAVAAGSN